MTPEHLTGLAALLLEFRDWIEETHPGNLDAHLVDACADACGRFAYELVKEGAK